MAQSTPLPTRAALRDLLSDLVGQPVAIAEATAQALQPERPARGAVYRRDDGTVAALCVLDRELATAVGAGLGGLPAPGAAAVEAEEDGDLGGELDEYVREVVNIVAKLLNAPGAPHVALRDVRRLPGEVPSDEASVLLTPRRRVDYRVRVDGYPQGTVTFVAA